MKYLRTYESFILNVDQLAKLLQMALNGTDYKVELIKSSGNASMIGIMCPIPISNGMEKDTILVILNTWFEDPSYDFFIKYLEKEIKKYNHPVKDILGDYRVNLLNLLKSFKEENPELFQAIKFDLL